MKRFLMAVLLASCAGLALAGAMEPVDFDDPDKDARYRALLHELRCTVCQNQSLADSNAELAGDLRREVERLVASGADRSEVVDFMVSRYGDFVLYRPPVRPATYLLWAGPFLLLGVGVLLWYRTATAGSASALPPTASGVSRRRAARLLRGEES